MKPAYALTYMESDPYRDLYIDGLESMKNSELQEKLQDVPNVEYAGPAGWVEDCGSAI